MKKYILLTLCLLISMTTLAQEKEKLKAEVSADFVSTYIWRGLDLSKLSVQPSLLLDYRGLSLEVWGSYELAGSNDYKELDLILAYETGGFKFKLSDIWNIVARDTEKRYFWYNALSTHHVFEAYISYNFGPVILEWNTIFAGKDYMYKSKKRAYSSYFEANVPFRLAGIDWNGTLGVVPYASSGYFTNGFAVTNVELKVSKDIKVTDSFRIPVFIDISANPCLQKVHMAFGITLKP